MLTKEEESFLEDTIEAIKAGQWIPNKVPNTFEWLAEKLKETNDELKELKIDYGQLSDTHMKCVTEMLEEIKGKE